MGNRIISIHFTHTFRWLISKNDPISHNLISLPDWTLINPLLYPKLFPAIPNEPFYRELYHKVLFVFQDHTLLETDTLMFFSTSFDEDKFDSTAFTNHMISFFSYLRHTSKQAELMGIAYTSMISTARHPLGEEPFSLQNLSSYFPTIGQFRGSHFYKYHIDTAIRWHHMKKADENLANNDLPVYSTLLLDAIHAIYQNDFRKAILYSAMSVESLALTKLNERYKSLINSNDPTGMIRIITIQTGNETVQKDPIFEILFDRPNFRRLLHQCPLYLERRSLQVENEALYQQADKLYTTRNKIAHLGDLPSEKKNDLFNFKAHDAFLAIECAKDIFKWFGITEEYYVNMDETVNTDQYVLK